MIYSVERMAEWHKELEEHERALFNWKRGEYGATVNAIANFEQVGRFMGVKPSKVALMWLLKHLQGIQSSVESGKYSWEWETAGGEGLKQRFADARNYLVLLGGCLEAEQECTLEPEAMLGVTGGVKMVYLGGPIDMDSSTDKYKWREKAMNLFSQKGITCFSPPHAFSWAGSAEPKIMDVNWAVLKNCDAMLAYVSSTTPSIGTPREIQQALNWGKPVVVFTDLDPSKIVYLQDMPVFKTVEEAADYLVLL